MLSIYITSDVCLVVPQLLSAGKTWSATVWAVEHICVCLCVPFPASTKAACSHQGDDLVSASSRMCWQTVLKWQSSSLIVRFPPENPHLTHTHTRRHEYTPTHRRLARSLCLLCACKVYITILLRLCFSASWKGLHEIEHFSCWFAVKWCACAGLRRVSLSVESNRATAEGRKRRRGGLIHLLLPPPLQSVTQSQHCAVWTNSGVKKDTCGNTNNAAHMNTRIELQVHARAHMLSVYAAQEGGKTWELNKQRLVTVVEGEPASNERIGKRRDGWERDEGLLLSCII